MRHVIGDHIPSPAEPAERAGVVRESVDIAAPAADVFRALVDPRELAAWLGGEPMPSDPRDGRPDQPTHPLPGAAWRSPAIAPDGSTGTVAGEYLTVVPPHRIETTWRASWNGFATERVRFELVPIDVGGVAGTRVTVTHTRAEARLHATRAVLSHTEMPADAWQSLLAALAAHVATTQALARWAGASGDAPTNSFDALHRAVVDLHHAH
jgi:uncharacterized protein YndB with AHSA1/START domain